MTTPYITPDILTSAPTGIAWNTIPVPQATARAQEEEQFRICQRATGACDSKAGQPLRATIDSENIDGPDWRITINQTGVARVTCARWPVLKIISAQVSPATAFPRVWTPIPTTALDFAYSPVGEQGTIDLGEAGDGASAIVVSPGFLSWAYGRNGLRLNIVYINGWPHAGLTANAAENDTALVVDDVTGWAGVRGTIKDGSQQEDLTVSSVVAANGSSPATGPGTLTLSTGLTWAHKSGILVTTLPPIIEWAAILKAVAQALLRGGTAIAVPALRVASTGSGLSGRGAESLNKEADEILSRFARVW